MFSTTGKSTSVFRTRTVDPNASSTFIDSTGDSPHVTCTTKSWKFEKFARESESPSSGEHLPHFPLIVGHTLLLSLRTTTQDQILRRPPSGQSAPIFTEAKILQLLRSKSIASQQNSRSFSTQAFDDVLVNSWTSSSFTFAMRAATVSI
jgi:hypothetical protein